MTPREPSSRALARVGFAGALGAAVVALVGTVAAEPVPSLDLRGFRPPTDPESSVYLEPTSTPGQGNWNAALWLSYANRPVVLESPSGDDLGAPVEHQVSLDYVAALGLLDRLAVGLTVPTVVHQSGDDVSRLVGGAPLPRTALGDVGFSAKATLVPTGELGGFGLAALGRVTAPTGDQTSYLGEGEVTGEMRLLGEVRLPGLALRATGGAKIRGDKRRFAGEELGHDLPWGAGVSFRPQAVGLDSKGRWEWNAEAHGAIAITPDLGAGPQSPVVAALSGRYSLGDAYALAGVELPLNGAVGNPTFRPVLAVGWAPRFHDADGDGVADDRDECEELPEDRDGHSDHDGCPDYDDDDDGVPDEDDRCPTAQEDADGFEDDDGCPDADDDGDTIPDADDPCPREAGPVGPGAVRPGCPVRDTDGDGVVDDSDRCPTDPEDRDGNADEDGCPDTDDDGDGILDVDDECPRVAGAARPDTALHGCPSPDRDGDTIDDAADRCPDQPEDWDGDADDDGCPDPDDGKPPAARKKPLVTIDDRGAEPLVRFASEPRFTRDGAIEPASMPLWRALATELSRHPRWLVAIGARPAGRTPEAEQEALNRSFAAALVLRRLTYRDDVAEAVGWPAVADLPGARQRNVAVLILAPKSPEPR